MNGEFNISVDVAPEMLRNTYTARHQQVFGGFTLRMGDQSLPTNGLVSGEFLLVMLLHWNRALVPLVEGTSRAAKLFFTMTEGEIWVRKTARSLWKVSYIDYLQKQNRIRAEVLCIPERLETGLLTVSRKVLTGAKQAGIWTPDCVEMERFLDNIQEDVRHFAACTEARIQHPPTLSDPREAREEIRPNRSTLGTSFWRIPEEVLRRIARSQLEENFADLHSTRRDDLVGSLVRQWRTYDGHAGLVTVDHRFWFHLVVRGTDGHDVNCTVEPSRVVAELLRANIALRQIPDLLHRVNVTQNVTEASLRIRLVMNPKSKTFAVEPLV